MFSFKNSIGSFLKTGVAAALFALALAAGAPVERVLRYVNDLRHVRLEITGDDLVAAGVRPSPALGEALRGRFD